MRAGQLRHRITIKELDGTRNDYNEESLSYSTVDEVWAEKVTPRGSEVVSGKIEVAERTVAWRIRYRDDVTTKMVVEDADGAEYDIEFVRDEVGTRRDLWLVCKER